MTGIGGISVFGGSHGHDMMVSTALVVHMVCEWYWWYPLICMYEENAS